MGIGWLHSVILHIHIVFNQLQKFYFVYEIENFVYMILLLSSKEERILILIIIAKLISKIKFKKNGK